MSLLMCDECERGCDADDDPDGFYVVERPDQYICAGCRHRRGYTSEFDAESGAAKSPVVGEA